MTNAALKLYDHVDALEIVREWIYENEEAIIAAGGELPPELEELLDQVKAGLGAKAESTALVVRELLSSAKAVKEEVDRLAARVKHYESAAEGLKGYLLAQLQRAKIQKIEGKLVTVAVQKNPPAVKCMLDESTLLSMFMSSPASQTFIVEIPAQYRLDSRAVVTAWKAGAALPDGVTVEQGSHIRIR